MAPDLSNRVEMLSSKFDNFAEAVRPDDPLPTGGAFAAFLDLRQNEIRPVLDVLRRLRAR